VKLSAGAVKFTVTLNVAPLSTVAGKARTGLAGGYARAMPAGKTTIATATNKITSLNNLISSLLL
jgi:hypothetical protein